MQAAARPAKATCGVSADVGGRRILGRAHDTRVDERSRRRGELLSSFGSFIAVKLVGELPGARTAARRSRFEGTRPGGASAVLAADAPQMTGSSGSGRPGSVRDDCQAACPPITLRARKRRRLTHKIVSRPKAVSEINVPPTGWSNEF